MLRDSWCSGLVAKLMVKDSLHYLQDCSCYEEVLNLPLVAA